jgi:hypothetical protein
MVAAQFREDHSRELEAVAVAKGLGSVLERSSITSADNVVDGEAPFE